MKIVFMGTPDFAVGALEALIGAGHEITAVVTQPDKPKGRSGQLQPSPVKECALKYGIPVFQPKRIKTPEAVLQLKEFEADVYVVAAFGQILSQEILDIPKYGCLNIHASLLPKYRGTSPIQHVIIAGEEKSGVTIMQMDAGVDTGDMLYKKEVEISDADTFETLHDKLMKLGGEAIVEALVLLEEGKIIPVKQSDEESCYASLIDKSMGKLDFSQSAVTLDRLIRGMNPWPSAYTFYKGKQLKIWRAVPIGASDAGNSGEGISGAEASGAGASLEAAESPAWESGVVRSVEKDFIDVVTGEGILRIYELQLEGKKRMSAHDFLLGVRIKQGEKLG